MRKTALSICQNVFYRINEPAISTLLSLTEQGDLQVRQILYDVCRHLRREGPFRQQIQNHSFATVASTNTYPLPRSYYKAVPWTFYNQNSNWQLIGPLSDAEFQAYKVGELYIPTEFVWRIAGFDENALSESGRQIEIYPTPSAVVTLSFDFVTGHLFVPPNWASSTAYVIGDYVNVNGRIYLCDTNGTSGSTPPSGTDDNQSDGTTQWDHYDDPYDTIQDDADYCIFDADLVELGLRAWYAEEQGGAIAQRAEARFLREIDVMRYRFDGQSSARGDQSSAGGGTMHRPYVSPGSWSFS